ncbi:MAG: glycosyltransferase [Mucilaginibacter polytrichastri]|nr:glycosyltransferase [Mucilaginibacter polytrichastri]
MKIALTADPEIAVPPEFYGGIERIIYLLAESLYKQGHEVTLFAHKNSRISGRIIPYRGTSSRSKADTLRNMLLISRTCLSDKFDIIHSFGRLAYLTPVLPLATPKLMSYQREPTISQLSKARKLSRASLSFTGCSRYISDQIAPFTPSHAIYNCVDFSQYDLQPQVSADAPLIFLGRVEPVKGPHLAIDIALQTGRRLIIAGNIPEEHQSYFDEKIRPFIDDKKIIYAGPVNDKQKNELLGAAAALLMPIEWNEPFGIVMIEAMACGTPVLGLSRGAVPEVIDQDLTGFHTPDKNELASFVAQISGMNRRAVREQAQKRFDVPVITREYLNLYQQLISR